MERSCFQFVLQTANNGQFLIHSQRAMTSFAPVRNPFVIPTALAGQALEQSEEFAAFHF